MDNNNKTYFVRKDLKSRTPWNPQSPEQYEDFFENFAVTHHGKLRNSNVESIGVLVPSNTRSKRRLLPGFVSYRHLVDKGIWSGGLDYSKLKSGFLAIAEHIHRIMNGDDLPDASPAEVSLIQQKLEQLPSTPKTVGTKTLDRRLAQILLPQPQGNGFFSVTPLESGALSEVFRTRFKVIQESFYDQAKKKESFETQRDLDASKGFYIQFPAVIPHPLGGGIPRNASYYANKRVVQSPLMAFFPIPSKEIISSRKAFYRGKSAEIWIPKALVIEYAHFRAKHIVVGQDFPSTLSIRKEESRIIGNVAKAALTFLNRKVSQLSDLQDSDPVFDQIDNMEIFDRGCWVPGLRDKAWGKEFAERVVMTLENHRHKDSLAGKAVKIQTINISPQARPILQGWVYEAIQKTLKG